MQNSAPRNRREAGFQSAAVVSPPRKGHLEAIYWAMACVLVTTLVFTDLCVVQYRALQGCWKEKKLSGNDKLSGLGDTRVNNCTVLSFNYLILFS